MITDRRVVITGSGVVTPVGNDVDTFWGNLKNGVSGIGKIQAFDTAGLRLPDRRARCANFDPKNYFKNPKDVRRTDRFAQFAMAAAKMAMDDSGIDLEKVDRRPLRRDRQQRHRRPENSRGSAHASC